MPYIPQAGRPAILRTPLQKLNDLSVGELNYVITYLCKKHISERGLHYQTLNDVVGVLESAKLEFYRRIVAPYEQTKIIENGDVE